MGGMKPHHGIWRRRIRNSGQKNMMLPQWEAVFCLDDPLVSLSPDNVGFTKVHVGFNYGSLREMRPG